MIIFTDKYYSEMGLYNTKHICVFINFFYCYVQLSSHRVNMLIL